MMTVKQLKEICSRFNDESVVVRADNSGGFEDIYEVHEKELAMTFDIKNNKKGDKIKAIVLE